MARPKATHPTDRELEILRVLWDTGPASLGTVCAELRKNRPLATTTVATMLGVMLDKRLVARAQGPRGYAWSAKVSREQAAGGLVGRLLDRVFDGSAHSLVAHLVEEGRLTDEELQEIERLLKANRKRA